MPCWPKKVKGRKSQAFPFLPSFPFFAKPYPFAKPCVFGQFSFFISNFFERSLRIKVGWERKKISFKQIVVVDVWKKKILAFSTHSLLFVPCSSRLIVDCVFFLCKFFLTFFQVCWGLILVQEDERFETIKQKVVSKRLLFTLLLLYNFFCLTPRFLKLFSGFFMNILVGEKKFSRFTTHYKEKQLFVFFSSYIHAHPSMPVFGNLSK